MIFPNLRFFLTHDDCIVSLCTICSHSSYKRFVSLSEAGGSSGCLFVRVLFLVAVVDAIISQLCCALNHHTVDGLLLTLLHREHAHKDQRKEGCLHEAGKERDRFVIRGGVIQVSPLEQIHGPVESER